MAYTNKRTIRAGCLFLTAFLSSVASAPADASLIGDPAVTFELIRTDTNAVEFTGTTAVINPGAEFDLFSHPDGTIFTNLHTTVDIGASSIRIDHGSVGSLPFEIQYGEIMVLSGLDWFGEPTRIISGIEVTFGGVVKLAGQSNDFAAGNATFDNHSVTIDIAGYRFDNGTYIDIQLSTTDIAETSAPLPAPGSLGVFALGLVALSVVARRRRARVLLPTRSCAPI